MNEEKRITFDLALKTAVDKVKLHWDALPADVLLVRDLIGRIRFLLPGAKTNYDHNRLDRFSSEINRSLGAYASPPSTSFMERELPLFCRESQHI